MMDWMIWSYSACEILVCMVLAESLAITHLVSFVSLEGSDNCNLLLEH